MVISVRKKKRDSLLSGDSAQKRFVTALREERKEENRVCYQTFVLLYWLTGADQAAAQWTDKAVINKEDFLLFPLSLC